MQELFEQIGQLLLQIAQGCQALEKDRDEKLHRAAQMIEELLEANRSLMERINEMAEETAAVESKELDGLHGLEGLKALAEGKITPAEDDAEPDTGWIQ